VRTFSDVDPVSFSRAAHTNRQVCAEYLYAASLAARLFRTRDDDLPTAVNPARSALVLLALRARSVLARDARGIHTIPIAIVYPRSQHAARADEPRARDRSHTGGWIGTSVFHGDAKGGRRASPSCITTCVMEKSNGEQPESLISHKIEWHAPEMITLAGSLSRSNADLSIARLDPRDSS